MQGKIILLFMVVLNIISLIIGGVCLGGSNSCGDISDNSFLTIFFNVNESSINNNQASLELTNQFQNATTDLTEPQGSGTIAETISAIVDVLKMIAGALLLLTPVPIFMFASSMQVPLFVQLLLFAPLSIMYFIALVQLIRGADF